MDRNKYTLLLECLQRQDSLINVTAAALQQGYPKPTRLV